jgi:hypothetical protein
MNVCATFFLTSLVRHVQMGSRTSSSPVSPNRQQASTKWSQLKAQDIPAVDLCKMLSQCQGQDKASVMINGVEYVAKVHDVMYQVSNHKQMMLPLALIDCGANGGVAGSDTMTSTIIPLRLMVVGNDSLHQMVTSFPSMSGAVCHTSRCAPLQTRNSNSYCTFFG